MKKNNPFENFQRIMEEAISQDLLTNEALKSSDLHADYWLAATAMAKVIVGYNFHKYKNICSRHGYGFDDCVQILTLQLIEKYNAQVTAIIKKTKKQETHNFNAYCTTIFHNYMLDKNKKYGIKIKKQTEDANGKIHSTSVPVKTKDELGKEIQATYEFISLSTPLSDESDSAELDSITPSPELSPEERFILYEEIAERLSESPNKKSIELAKQWNIVPKHQQVPRKKSVIVK